MLSLRVVFVGARAAARALAGAAERLPDAIERAEVDGAQQIAREAATRAPRGRTGRLSGTTAVLRSGDRVGVGATVSYFWPVHSGVPGRGIPARPYVVQTGQALEASVVEGFEREVEQVTRGV